MEIDQSLYLPAALLMCPLNTDRPVNSRWLRVLDLAHEGSPATGKYDDDWIRNGLKYLKRLQAYKSNADRERARFHAARGTRVVLDCQAERLNPTPRGTPPLFAADGKQMLQSRPYYRR